MLYLYIILDKKARFSRFFGKNYLKKAVGTMKSIERKIVTNSIILVGASLLLLGVAAISSMFIAARTAVENNMREIVQISADRVEWQLKAYINIADGLGEFEELSDDTVSDVEKRAILQQWTDKYGLERCNLIALDGTGIDGNDYSERSYFKNAMNGISSISEPLVSKITGKLTIIVGAPLIRNGEIVGCVYVVPNEEFLNDIMRTIKVSENCRSYMIDSAGNIIADIDIETVKYGENIPEGENTGYDAVLEMRKNMTKGETGFATYKYMDVSTLAAYHPVDGTNGWSLAICSPQSDFMADTYRSIIATAAIMAVSLLVSAMLSVVLGKKIGKPIKLCSERIEKLSVGDLSSPMPKIKTNDETNILANATTVVLNNFNNIINDIGRVLGEISECNLNVDTIRGENYYSGDFRKILVYIDEIIMKLNGTITDINTASAQVAVGADQVSSAATSLSQGTTEQASSIEELASSIHIISDQVSKNSENCASARDIVNATASELTSANDEMKLLSEAMENISSTSHEIGNIIKTIEDIAFQTNILALNAAVEAARAGEAGKGFAVVADEVRNLASRSAEAAQDTTALIRHSMEAVENGIVIATGTASAMNGVGEKAGAVEEIVSKIAEASEHQAEMIDQLLVGIDQISSVVQTNSATAEESAAASEELSSQAAAVKNLMDAFILKQKYT